MSLAPVHSITNCQGYQQITDLDPAVGLTVPTRTKSGTLCQPTLAVLQCTTESVRWRDDGGTVDATTGMVLVVGDTLYYDGDLNKIRFFSATGILDVSYYS